MLMKRKKRVNTKKRSTKTPIIVKVSLVILTLFVIFATTFKITEFILTNKSDSFPKLEISLTDVPIEQIDMGSKDTKYPGNTATLTVDEKNTTYKNVEIKGRGNSTWLQIKKPYQIKFESKEDIFNLGANKKWILLANSLDPSYLRNDTAFYLENIFNEKYALSGKFLELYIDNQYRGLYYLSEKIEPDKHRVDLQEVSGVIVELDNTHTEPEKCLYTTNDNCMIIHDVINKDSYDKAVDDFMTNFNQLEKTVKKKDYKKITETIDIESFAKYFLLSEFTANPDAYSSSFFFYKDGENDKIHAGPGWDFDFSLGNTHWAWVPEEIEQEIFFSPFTETVSKVYAMTSSKEISPLLYDLMEIPEFETRVKEIYQETLSGRGEELLDYIRSQANYIRNAALRDQERWKLKSNFDEEVDYLIDWVAKRYDHFEQTYGAGSPPINKSQD